MLTHRRATTAMVTCVCLAMALTVPIGAQTDGTTVAVEAGMLEDAAAGGSTPGEDCLVWQARLDQAERAAGQQTMPPEAPRALGGTSWQLVKFQGSDDTTLMPDDPTKYTMAFTADGGLSVRIDCNRGRGTWKSSGPSQLQLGPLALTRAMCPPGSLHDQIVSHWGLIRSYIIKDGHLFLSLMADGGIYEFAPIEAARTQPRPRRPARP